MIALFDIGNTHTHIGLANSHRVLRQANVLTQEWRFGASNLAAARLLKKAPLTGAILCSVVPKATAHVEEFLRNEFGLPCLELTHRTIRSIGIDYPKPATIGPDRLANAVAVKYHYGAPAVVVDFGTAVTFDVVNADGNYIGGIIAPGLNAMTDYLHEKTALLPRIQIREVSAIVGKSTREAMLIGAVKGYRGLIRGLLCELKQSIRSRTLPVVATGGYAQLIASKLPEITAVDPNLTLEGLRLEFDLADHRLEP